MKIRTCALLVVLSLGILAGTVPVARAQGEFYREALRIDALAESLAWNPRGTLLAAAGNFDGAPVRIFNASTGQVVRSLRLARRVGATLVAWSADGSRLAAAVGTGSAGAEIVVWETNLFTVAYRLKANPPLAFSPDGKLLATAEGKGIRFWDARTGRSQKTFSFDLPVSADLASFAWSRDGKRIVCALAGPLALIIDAQTGRIDRTLSEEFSAFTTVGWARGGDQIYTVDEIGQIRFWDVQTGLVVTEFQFGGTMIAFTPDGRAFTGNRDVRIYLATDPRINILRIWDGPTTRLVAVLEGYQGLIHAMIWSPDSIRLATASEDGVIRIWARRGVA